MGILSKCFGGSSSSSSFTSRKQPSATVEDLCHRFSLEQLRKSTDGFDKSRLIAETIFSKEYRASISINGELKHVAVKRLRQEAAISSYGLISYKNNIIFRCQLHQENLVSLVGFCDDHNEMILVYDYAPKGSLRHQLYGTERNSPTLSWKRRLEIIIGVARGLHYLHSGTKRTIIYRDIKPASILLDENWVAKLKISGFSMKGPKFSQKNVKPELEFGEGTMGYIGTRGYVAPEHIMKGEVTHKCDVYSFGALLLELICGKVSFLIISQQKVRCLAQTGNGEGIIDERLVGEIAPQCLKLYMEITESCLSEDPNERPDMGEVEVQLEHVLQLTTGGSRDQPSFSAFLDG